MLFQCWASVEDGGPTLKQHWVNVPCFQGSIVYEHCDTSVPRKHHADGAWRARPKTFMAGYRPRFLVTWLSCLCYWGRWIIFCVIGNASEGKYNTVNNSSSREVTFQKCLNSGITLFSSKNSSKSQTFATGAYHSLHEARPRRVVWLWKPEYTLMVLYSGKWGATKTRNVHRVVYRFNKE